MKEQIKPYAKTSQRYIGILTKTLPERRTITLKTYKRKKDNLMLDGQIERFIEIEHIPKLNEDNANSIEGKFTESEIHDV